MRAEMANPIAIAAILSRLTTVTCPHCGARVQVIGASDEVRCEYCGTWVLAMKTTASSGSSA